MRNVRTGRGAVWALLGVVGTFFTAFGASAQDDAGVGGTVGGAAVGAEVGVDAEGDALGGDGEAGAGAEGDGAAALTTEAEPVDPLLAEAEAIEDVSLRELLNMETTVASTIGATVRESPGILTVITREEIVASGARDLMDVLSLVPGMYFGSDVWGVVGLGFRGNWGHEGKILLIIDGQEINETLYTTLTFGNRFPVDQIQRVEVIRGPGSVVYGGYAELAVIRITTRGADDIHGVAASATWGQNFDPFDYARRNLSLSFARPLTDDMDLAVHGFIGQGRRGQGTYTDFYGTSFDVSENETNPLFFNVGYRWRDLKVRLMAEHYNTTSRDMYDSVISEPVDVNFTNIWAGAEYALRVSDELTITPALNFRHQAPWNQTRHMLADGTNLDDLFLFYDRTTQRYQGQVTATYRFSEPVALTGGFQVYHDRASAPAGESEGVDYTNLAAFAQLAWQNPIVNLTLGARFENHSEFGPSFVPRVGLTKVIDQFHFKALFSLAFRAPGIENIYLQFDEIEPERTTAIELEAGYQIDDHNMVTLNAYDLTIARPIVYFYGDMGEGYDNSQYAGTRGVDLEYKLRYSWGFASLAYSLYVADSFIGSAFLDGDGRPQPYEVPGEDSAMLGLPNHKLALNTSFTFGPVRVSPWAVILGPRHAYTSAIDTDGDGVQDTANLEQLDTTVLLNLYGEYTFPVPVDGLRFGLGLFNILGSDNPHPQPYDSGFRPPLPGTARELVARLSYQQEI